MQYTITTVIKCPFCGRFSEVEVPAENYFLWQAGELVQIAFPQLDIHARETLISGLCMICQDNIFEEDDEDEDE